MSVIETTAPQTEEPEATDTSTQADTSDAGTQTDEAPEATPAVEEQPEVKATDTAEEKLYAGKYKTVEEMEKAYQELNSTFSKTSQEKAELSRILNEAFAAPEPSSAPPSQDDLYQEESNPVNQEIESLKRQTAVQGFIMNHQDADASQMGKILAEDPLVKQISGHEAKLEYAYLRSQNMAQSKAIAEAEKKGAQATQAKIAEKQVAQVETAGKTAERTDEKSELQERMSTGPVEQREKARREYIKKYLV